jgi:hypothetical protein
MGGGLGLGVSLAYFRVLDRGGVFQVVLADSPEPVLGGYGARRPRG